MILILTEHEAKKLQEYNEDLYKMCYNPKNGHFTMGPKVTINEIEKIWSNKSLQFI